MSHFLHQNHFKIKYFLPKYWLTWSFILIILFFSLTPTFFKRISAKIIGMCLYLLPLKSKKRMFINLTTCFSHLTQKEISDIIKENIITNIQILMNVGSLHIRSEKYKKNMIRFHNADHLFSLLEKKQPVILLTPHTLSVDFPAISLAKQGYSMAGIMKSDKNELLDWFITSPRHIAGSYMFERKNGMKSFILKIKSGSCGYYLPDEDHGNIQSEMVPFFDTYKATLPTLKKLTKITKATVIPMYASFDRKSNQFNVFIHPALSCLSSLSFLETAKIMNKEIEKLIQIAPEQYMWNLKILKTRKAGEKPIYPNL